MCSDYMNKFGKVSVVVNARFLTQDLTGVQRFAYQISKELKGNFTNDILFVSPKGIVSFVESESLDAIVVGKYSGHYWEQVELVRFLNKIGSPILINLANTAPILYKNKITVLHDIAFYRFSHSYSLPFRLFYRSIIPLVLKTSKAVVTVSDFSRVEISNLYNIPVDKIKVMYNSVDEFFSHNRTVNEKDEKFILTVSSLHAQKNIAALIDAFNTIADPDLKLYLVGSMNKSFRNSALEKSISNNHNIIFLGRVSDDQLISLYSKARCFVFPSLYEGFGIPPLEAQACGCPCIISRAASLPEIFGDSVIYFDPNNYLDIADKIEYFLNNDKLEIELVKRGFINTDRFSWKKSAFKLIDIIRE